MKTAETNSFSKDWNYYELLKLECCLEHCMIFFFKFQVHPSACVLHLGPYRMSARYTSMELVGETRDFQSVLVKNSMAVTSRVTTRATQGVAFRKIAAVASTTTDTTVAS